MDLYLSFGILREPTFLYALLLCEEFTDAPEGRGTEYAEERREVNIRDEQGCDDAGRAYDEIDHPGTRAPVVFRLDDDWMPDAYREEGQNGDDDSREIHERVLS